MELIAQEMNNGIHYYEQLKSNLTQGIPMLFSSSETVMSNAVLFQLIFYPTTEAHQQRGIFFLPKKKKEVHLCSLKEEKETKAVLLHIQIIFVLAHFSSVTHKKCLFIMHSVKLDRINILMYVNIYLYKLLSLLCLKSHMNDVRSSIKIHFFVLYSVTHANKNLLCKT